MNNYFYLDATNKQQGPITPDKFAACGVMRSTMVWRSGMSEWQRAEELPELNNFFDNNESQETPPEPPHHSTNNDRNYYQDTHTYDNYNGRPEFTQCPETHMMGAVIVTAISLFFGFSILGTLAGLVAIYNADSVSTNYRRGYFDEAEYASEKAKKWMKISLIVWVITRILDLVFLFLWGIFVFNPLLYNY